MTPFAGRHVLAELTDADPAVLDDEAVLRSTLHDALTEAGAAVLQVIAHRFAPHGVTVLALLAESHASLHSWPEHGAAFVDVFTCGGAADPERAVDLLATRLGARRSTTQTIPRGLGAPVREPLAPGLTRVWDVDETLYQADTGYQRLLIARTAQGVTLFGDGERQSTEASQLVYHEALLVPALLLAERVDDVLVIGSSEGVVSRIAAAAGARRVDHVDIDAECVRRCAELLPYGYSPAELRRAKVGNGPVHVHYADGAAFLGDADRYDVIVVDLPDERPDDLAAPHNRLYETDFLRRAAEHLTVGGVLVGQAGCATLWRNATLRRSVQRFDEVFPTVLHYGSDEHEWSFLTGAAQPVADPLEHMIQRLDTLPYRPQTLDAAALRRGAVLPYTIRTDARPATPDAPRDAGGHGPAR